MLRRRSSIRLIDLLGIRIGVDATWFVFLFLIIFWLSGYFRSALNSSDTVAYATTVVTVLLFFASLIVHELGHALAARRQGIEVRRIELFLFGGITQMSRDTATPAEELKVAAAGPAATLGFALLCAAVDLAIVGPHRLVHAILLDGTVPITPVLLSLSWLLLLNVAILAFNLIPAFPLDGGRLARALVWRRTGSKQRGTEVSAALGQGFAVLLGAGGVALMLSGAGLNGLWLIALAFLLGSSARGARAHNAVSQRIDAVRIADVMDPQPVAIPAATPVAQALEEYFLRYGWSWFPVTDEAGRLLGIARREVLQGILDSGEGWLSTGSAVGREEPSGLRVRAEGPLSEAIGAESLRALGAVMAVDADGVLRGVLTVEQLRRALRARLAG